MIDPNDAPIWSAPASLPTDAPHPTLKHVAAKMPGANVRGTLRFFWMSSTTDSVDEPAGSLSAR